jgi:translocation and assembly module TamA
MWLGQCRVRSAPHDAAGACRFAGSGGRSFRGVARAGAWTACLLLALMLAASALAQDAEPLRYRVQIEAPAELRDLLQEGLDLMRWQDDAEMTPALLERLVEEAEDEIEQAAAARGWFSAKVRSEIDRQSTPWRVDLRVEPGARTQVTRVEIAFTGPVTDDAQARELMREVRADWSLPSGQPFRQSEWDDAKQAAVRALSAWRYAAARIVDSRAVVDPQAQTAALSVTLDSGPPFHFGPIQVTGVERHTDELVRNLSPFRPGATYDLAALERYQSRLLDTGYFISAHVELDTDPAAAPGAPVRVAVIEGASQRLELGLRYTSDIGFSVEGRYDDVDLRNSGWRLRGQLDTGLEVQRAQASLDLPPMRDGRWVGLFARLQHDEVQNQESTELAFGAALNHGLLAAPSGPAVSVHTEQLRVAGMATDNRRAVLFAYRQTFIDTDDPVTPQRGILGSASIGFAPAGLSTRQFWRVQSQATWLRPLGRAGSLQLRGEVGAVLAGDSEGVPSSLLFRTGGDLTVRGYEFDSLGVRRGDAVLAARYLALGSVEYIRWIGENWGAAVFVDAGDAWDDRQAFDLALGYGVGARFRTPIGPIRADLAYGERSREIRLHLSIGYRF